jgi:hypothetical protein
MKEEARSVYTFFNLVSAAQVIFISTPEASIAYGPATIYIRVISIRLKRTYFFWGVKDFFEAAPE